MLADTFARLNAIATPDVAYLYEQLGGMENMTNAYWRHWPMEEILLANKQPSAFGVLFADYLISSWAYRLKAVSDSTSAVYVDHFDGHEPTLVAGSLEQFFDNYLRSAGEWLHVH